jgi:hypothetical protein
MSAGYTTGDSMVVLAAPPTTKGPADRFTDDVRVDGITEEAGPGCARLAMVRFSSGARNGVACRCHGQSLHVTDSRGLVGPRTGRRE